jgi:enamine deaminase RidA (YjgF/YER057c/UK114 family)
LPVNPVTPDALAPAHGYHHVVETTGATTVYTSGQVAVDPSGALVGPGDYSAQAYQAAMNMWAALEAASAGPPDVAKINIFVVDLGEATMAAVYQGLGRASREVGAQSTATTLIGVSALGVPGALFEIEATAVLAR